MRIHGWLMAVALCGCNTGDVKQYWEPYVGDAFPHQGQPVPWPAGPIALTSDNGSDTVTAFDPLTGQLLAQRHVGRDPVANDGPHHLAVDRKAGLVYVALAYPAPPIAPGPHAAHGSSSRPGYVQQLRLDDLTPAAEVRIDANPGDIVLSADGKLLAATHFDLQIAQQAGPLTSRRGSLTLIDVASFGQKTPRSVQVCVLPHGMALTADRSKAWVACYGEDAIAVVDLNANPPDVKQWPLGPNAVQQGAPAYGPYSAVLSPDGGLLAVGSTESRDVRFFDTAANAVQGQPWPAPSQAAPYFAAWSADGAQVWVPTQSPDALHLVELATRKTLQSRTFTAGECQKPHEAQRGPNGVVLVACEGDHVQAGKVIAVDPQSLQTQWTVATGAYPDRIALAGAL